MKVQILVRGRNVEVTKGLRAHVEHRVGTALGRFGDRIGVVVVRFTDGDGTTGAPDGTRCEMQVSLRPRAVRIAGTDRDAFSVIEEVSVRASRSIARALEREQDLDPSPFRVTPTRRVDR